MDRRKGTREAVTAEMEWTPRVAQLLVRLEWFILAAIYAYFVITDTVPVVALGVVILIWAARFWLTQKLFRFTPLDLPIAVILVWLPVSLAVSTNWSLSLPKVTGIVLGVLCFYTTVATVRSAADAKSAAVWLCIIFAAIALAGLVGTDWAQGKIVSLSFVYDRLPRLIQGIPRSIAGGFARNGVGGTLTLTVPFLTALLLEYFTADGRPQSANRRKRNEGEATIPGARGLSAVGGRRSAVVISIALVLSLVTLALTQSRGAILGTAVGLLAVAIWRERRIAWLVLVPALAIVLVTAFGQWDSVLELMLRMDARTGTLASRVEVWQRGVMMVQDFPFTGIGIGTFNDVAHGMYPFFIAAPNEVVAHAHNNVLQVAVDLGIPGAIAFIALVTAFVVCSVRAYCATSDPTIRAVIVGSLCGMLAHQVFGLTDAFILGTKPGVLIWIYMGLAVALYQNRGVQPAHSI